EEAHHVQWPGRRARLRIVLPTAPSVKLESPDARRFGDAGWRLVMTRFDSPRWWLAGAMVVALAVGSLVAADRSSSAMATAASKFLASLTPEQRQQASFEFNSDERLRWHFIPTEMFPRKGLLVRDMNEAQRKAAHDLFKAGLSQRGYLTASSIMDLE